MSTASPPGPPHFTLQVSHQPLAILHILRAPVGGLMRHVEDLIRGQIEAGHQVGLVCSSTHTPAATEERLARLADALPLGLHRVAIPRLVGPADITAIRTVRTLASHLNADIVHGHGAKGGLLARCAVPGRASLRQRQLAGPRPVSQPRAIYTPHGGSLHYDPRSLAGMIYLAAERWLAPRTDAFIFESLFAREAFAMKVGRVGGFSRVIHNGIGGDDFEPLPDQDTPYDIAFVGELRLLKGVDTLLEALAQLRGRKIKAIIAGDGPDRDYFINRACDLDLAHMVAFPGMQPAREVFAQAQLLIVPSYAESLPYVVLEAAAAGLPVVATRVGGIPEIFGPQASRLVPPNDTKALATAIEEGLQNHAAAARGAAELRTYVARNFSISRMVNSVEEVYRAALQNIDGPYYRPLSDTAAAHHSVYGA